MSLFLYPTTFIFLLCFIITVNSAPLSTEISSLSNLYQNYLSSDSDAQHVIQYGNDVKLISSGSIELILTYRSLVVDVNIKSCIGKVLFCYESSKIENEAAKLCFKSGYCGFQLIGTENEIESVATKVVKKFLEDCMPIEMKYSDAHFCGIGLVPSCNPEIDAEGRIKIEVSDVGCPVTIKNAQIYVPPATTSSTTSSILDSDSASNAGLQWYYWILIVFGILLIVFCGVGIWICVWKKNILSDCKKKSAKIVPVESIVSTTVTQEIKTVTKEEKMKEEPKLKVESKPKTPKPSTEPASAPAPAPTGKPKEIPKAVEKPLKKEAVKEKKKSKSKTPSTESYSAPFCLLPFPAQPFEPEPEPVQEPPAKKRPRNEEGRRSRHMDSLELADDRINGIDTITKIEMERRKRSRKRY